MCSGKAKRKRTSLGGSYVCKVAFVLSIIGTAQAAIIPAPTLPYGNDSVRTSDGFQCSSAVAPSSYIDAGVYQDDDNKKEPDRGVYVRVLVPIYGNKNRLDCSKLYEQELKAREREQALGDLKAKVFN